MTPKKQKSILHIENGGYQSFDIIVWFSLLFYHGYIWESIENHTNASHLTLEKKLAEAESFLHFAQFCMKNAA